MIRLVKYTVITLFLLVMTLLAYNVYNKYIERQELIKSEQLAIDEVMSSKSTKQKIDLQLPNNIPNNDIPPPPPPPKKNEPNGSIEHIESPTAKVEVVGVVKFEISEDNSWDTVFKILAIILGSVLGIRIINTGFSKLERKI